MSYQRREFFIKRKIYSIYLIQHFLSIISLFFSIVVLLDSNKPNYFNLLPLLPLSYAIVNFLSSYVWLYIKKQQNISLFIISILFFIRNSLAVFFLCIGNYTSTLNHLTVKNTDLAIISMIIEICFTYIFLSIYCYNRRFKVYRRINYTMGKEKIRQGNVVLLFLVLVLLFLFFSFPNIRNSFSSLFSNDLSVDSYVQTKNSSAVGTISRNAFTIFNVLFDAMRIILPCCILYLSKKRLGDQPLSILIGIMLCVIQFFMVMNETMFVFISAFITVVFMYHLFPKYSKFLITFFGILGTVLLVSISIKISLTVSVGESFFDRLSDMFQVYIPGVTNISCGFNVISVNKLNILKNDLIETIPFHNSLFDFDGVRFSDLYNTVNGVKYTIAPFLSRNIFFFGGFFPLITCFVCWIAIRSEQKLFFAKSVGEYCFFFAIMIYSIMTIFCYHQVIFLSRLFSTFIPIYFIGLISRKGFNLIRGMKPEIITRKRLYKCN